MEQTGSGDHLLPTWYGDGTCQQLQLEGRNRKGPAELVFLHRNKDEINGTMQIIHSQKVQYLKRAIFNLQGQNAILVDELIRCSNQQIDLKNDLHTMTDSTKSVQSQTDLQPEYGSVEYFKNILENILSLGTDIVNTELLSSDISSLQKIVQSERKIKQLEREVIQQRLLVQQQKFLVKSLLESRNKFREKLKRRLRLQWNRMSSELQALLIEEKAKRLLAEANYESERSKQLELYVNAFQETFQDLFISAQAESSKKRFDDLQRINELEKKLTELLP